MTRREPVQQRSRDSVEKILTAATELLHQGGVDALTTRAVAKHSGVPVATIYRYFSDSDAIIKAFLNREMEAIDAAVTTAVLRLEKVTLRNLIETFAIVHLRHHQDHPNATNVWFGGRRSLAVIERVTAQDAMFAEWVRNASQSAGMLRPDAPDYGAELLVRLFDRMFEWVFMTPHTVEEQEEIVMRFVDMTSSYLEQFATAAGIAGIPAQELLKALDDGSDYRE